MKKIVGVLAAVALAALGFKLFEPVFVWRMGWENLPPVASAVENQTADDWKDVGGGLDDWLAGARTELDAPSLSAAVSIDGAIIWAGAVGHADIAKSEAATPSTVYRIGSSSKAVTSVAMGALLDAGAVDLEAPLSRYMPDLSAPLSGVTVRQAMSHTGGVRNYGLCLCFPAWEHLNRRHYDGAQRETLRPFEKSPLLFPPGEGFVYTSLGYNALGGVIEAASEKSFEAHVRDAVFAPLGMTRSGLESGAPRQGLAKFYEVEDGAYKLAFAVDNSNKLPSGGMLSTPSDMTRLGAAMIGSTLFAPATRDRLIDPQELKDGSPNDQGYALGWRFNPAGEVLDGAVVTPRYSHHGAAQGSTSYFIVYPDYDLIVSVMMNKGQTDLDDMIKQATPMIDQLISEIARRRGV